jgi:hypothetical protein
VEEIPKLHRDTTRRIRKESADELRVMDEEKVRMIGTLLNQLSRGDNRSKFTHGRDLFDEKIGPAYASSDKKWRGKQRMLALPDETFSRAVQNLPFVLYMHPKRLQVHSHNLSKKLPELLNPEEPVVKARFNDAEGINARVRFPRNQKEYVETMEAGMIVTEGFADRFKYFTVVEEGALIAENVGSIPEAPRRHAKIHTHKDYEHFKDRVKSTRQVDRLDPITAGGFEEIGHGVGNRSARHSGELVLIGSPKRKTRKITLSQGAEGDEIINVEYWAQDYQIVRQDKLRVGDKLLDRCFSADTQILVKSGWKFIKDIQLNDEIMTLENNDVMEYQKATAFHEHDDKRMYHISNQQIDLMVTPDHDMYIKPRYKNKFEFVKAKDVFGKRVEYKKDGIWLGEEVEFIEIPSTEITKSGLNGTTIVRDEETGRIVDAITNRGRKEYTVDVPAKQVSADDLLELIGYYISEGSTTYNRGYRISISQSKSEENRKKIYDCFVRLGYNPHLGKEYIGVMNKQLYEYLEGFGKRAWLKKVKPGLLALSKRQLKILFDGLMLGDGIVNNNGKPINYITTSKLLADQMQEIALKIGLAANITYHSVEDLNKYDSSKIKSKHGIYDVRLISTKLTPMVNHGHVHQQNVQTEEWVVYDGKTYCVTVPNGIVYVRRNGKPVWCGNSGLKGIVSDIVPKMGKDAKGRPYDLIANYDEVWREADRSTAEGKIKDDTFYKQGKKKSAIVLEHEAGDGQIFFFMIDKFAQDSTTTGLSFSPTLVSGLWERALDQLPANATEKQRDDIVEHFAERYFRGEGNFVSTLKSLHYKAVKKDGVVTIMVDDREPTPDLNGEVVELPHTYAGNTYQYAYIPHYISRVYFDGSTFREIYINQEGTTPTDASDFYWFNVMKQAKNRFRLFPRQDGGIQLVTRPWAEDPKDATKYHKVQMDYFDLIDLGVDPYDKNIVVSFRKEPVTSGDSIQTHPVDVDFSGKYRSTIGMNPQVALKATIDYDGDAVAVFVPAIPDAVSYFDKDDDAAVAAVKKMKFDEKFVDLYDKAKKYKYGKDEVELGVKSSRYNQETAETENELIERLGGLRKRSLILQGKMEPVTVTIGVGSGLEEDHVLDMQTINRVTDVEKILKMREPRWLLKKLQKKPWSELTDDERNIVRDYHIRRQLRKVVDNAVRDPGVRKLYDLLKQPSEYMKEEFMSKAGESDPIGMKLDTKNRLLDRILWNEIRMADIYTDLDE